MTITVEDVRAVLQPEEPNYERGAALGPEAIPHLAVLASDPDPLMAAKAVELAGRIGGPGALQVVSRAARSPAATLRVASAAACAHLPTTDADAVIVSLLDDSDAGVVKVAVGAVRGDSGAEVVDRLRHLRDNGLGPGVRELASRALEISSDQ
jgi:hypothetical protein